MSQQSPLSANPFLSAAANAPAGCRMVAIKGKRNGYIMLAPAQEVTTYANLPDEIMLAAKDWAAWLEQAGSPRTYWAVWSEVTRHLHIHLFPRWPEDTLQGVALFETRDSEPQPDWTPETLNQLTAWAERYGIAIG